MSPWLAARNILAVRLDNVGDVVLLGPALRAIKETLPQARLTLLASPAGATAAPLLPWIDEVISWRAIWQDVGGKMPFDPSRERQLIDELSRRRFDAALIFTSFSQTPHVPGYACYLAGIPLRAGESKEFGGSTLTVELRSGPDDLHQVERNLRLVEQLGFPVRDRRLAVRIPAEARRATTGLIACAGLEASRPFVLLHPGASCQARRFPAERLREVAYQLGQAGWQVLVTGSAPEAELIGFVASVGTPGIGALAGRTSLVEFAALVERAALVICGNTLPLHLADAVGTPVLGLYSGTDYEQQWRPRFTAHRLLRRPTPCTPCYRFDCPFGQPCLDFSAEEIVEAGLNLLTCAPSDRERRRA